MTADAQALSTPEGKVSVHRPAAQYLGSETLRIERLGVRPECRMPMGDEGTQSDRRPGRDAKTPDLVVVEDVALHDPDRRIESHRFLNDAGCVTQFRQVRERHPPVADHRHYLLAQSLCNLGMSRQQIPCPA